eukprot:scaffold18741_cov158-Skeletonema_marinoi.AAC.3
MKHIIQIGKSSVSRPAKRRMCIRQGQRPNYTVAMDAQIKFFREEDVQCFVGAVRGLVRRIDPKIGFDIILCNSDTCPPPSRSGCDAKSNNITTSLIAAEKSKFQRGRATSKARTCRDTGVTISGEEIIEDLYNSKMQLIPFAISPLGLFGPTVNRFLYGKTIDSNNIHNINANTFPHARKMANRASSTEVPSIILERANDIWRRQHPTENFGLSYKSPDPSTYYTQQFGRVVCFANGSAGLSRSHLLTRRRPLDQVITQQHLLQ